MDWNFLMYRKSTLAGAQLPSLRAALTAQHGVSLHLSYLPPTVGRSLQARTAPGLMLGEAESFRHSPTYLLLQPDTLDCIET